MLVACTEQGSKSTVPTGPHGAISSGWTAVIDLSKAPKPERFVLTGDVLEVTQGDNATLWHPEHRALGSYSLSAEVTHLDSGLHPHGAGITFGGVDIEGKQQNYAYFMVRGDGYFLIKTRHGNDTADVVPWTKHEAIAPEDDDLVTHNRLTIEVTALITRFWINDQIVHSAPTADLPSGDRCGFRTIHDIHVRFGPLQLLALGR
jgi:hypothetical protein